LYGRNSTGQLGVLARGQRTNIPMQALLLLNDSQYLEAARVRAQQLLQAQGNDLARLRSLSLFRQATSRIPTPRELAELQSLLEKLRAEYRRHPEAARKLVGLGETKPNTALAQEELAAWSLVVSTVLNLDEVLNK
ncbi:MAG: DUF1553 domain-containing protein, partial [Gemmataceae bacterium]